VSINRQELLNKALQGATTDHDKLIAYQQFRLGELTQENIRLTSSNLKLSNKEKARA
jgi:hypothetical protein